LKPWEARRFTVLTQCHSGQTNCVARKTLRDFYDRHADSKPPPWKPGFKKPWPPAGRGRRQGPQEIKSRYPSVDILPGNRVVFNIKGNSYRLIVKIHYNTGIVFVRFVGTHADYDKVDAATL
jgi:mRNA interferase HigB